MKVALLQYGASTDKAANLAKALGLTLQALKAGVRFVLLPEMFNFRGAAANKGLFLPARENIPGPSTELFAKTARTYGAYILLGSFLEKAKGNYAYNTSVLIGPHGKIAAKYRKIHLFGANIGAKMIRETDLFLPGRSPALAKAEGFSVGMSVCYDVRFGDLYQTYARQAADILTVPSCFTRTTGQAHWEILLRARAVENLAYVLAPAQIGKDARGIEAYGHSMIVSPWGEVLACGSLNREEIIFGEITHGEIAKARKILPGIMIGRTA